MNTAFNNIINFINTRQDKLSSQQLDIISKNLLEIYQILDHPNKKYSDYIFGKENYQIMKNLWEEILKSQLFNSVDESIRFVSNTKILNEMINKLSVKYYNKYPEQIRDLAISLYLLNKIDRTKKNELINRFNPYLNKLFTSANNSKIGNKYISPYDHNIYLKIMKKVNRIENINSILSFITFGLYK